MAFAIKTEIREPDAEVQAFVEQKTMYGGKHVAAGDIIFLFASENEGGQGLVAKGTVIEVAAVPTRVGVARQTPRVSLTIRVLARARRSLGRSDLKGFANWTDGRPESELNFKFYRQATNKVIGLSQAATDFLEEHF